MCPLPVVQQLSVVIIATVEWLAKSATKIQHHVHGQVHVSVTMSKCVLAKIMRRSGCHTVVQAVGTHQSNFKDLRKCFTSKVSHSAEATRQ